jgi:hypothetical protein
MLSLSRCYFTGNTAIEEMPPRMSSVGLRAFRLGICSLLLGNACSAPEQPGVLPRTPVGRQAYDSSDLRWEQMPIERGTIWFERGSFPSSKRQELADSVQTARTRVIDKLALGRDTTLELFFVASRQSMQRIVGAPIAGFVQPGQLAAFFVASPGYRPPITHELTHVYTMAYWGQSAQVGDPSGPRAWLGEGVATLVAGSCQGITNDEMAAALQRVGALPTVNELTTRFRALPEDAGMPAAGSLAQFIFERRGTEGLRDLWLGGTVAPAMERAWRAKLDTIRPRRLDIARVMREGC